MRPAVLLVSLGLHLSIAFFLFYSLPSSIQSMPEAVEISVIEKVRPKLKVAGLSRRSKVRFVSKDSLDSAFFPRLVPAISGSYSDSRPYDTSISEVFGADGNQNWSFHHEIYSRIDSGLVFDSLLAQYGHFGKVQVQFSVTQEGLLLLENLKVQADDQVLKVHVLRAISKSLREPVNPVKFSKVEGNIIFQAQFDFSFGEESNFIKQKNFGRPVFVFKRSTIEKPVPREVLEQLLSGGVTPNISLMVDRWKKFNKKKYLEGVQFDPFEGYKNDPFYHL
jgi:hypothetical protein